LTSIKDTENGRDQGEVSTEVEAEETGEAEAVEVTAAKKETNTVLVTVFIQIEIPNLPTTDAKGPT